MPPPTPTWTRWRDPGSAAGGLTQSIDWVAWRGLGFGADAALVLAELERLGSRPIEADEAFAAWAHIAALDVAQAVVIPTADGERRDVGSRTPGPAGTGRSCPPTRSTARCPTACGACWPANCGSPEHDLPVDRPFTELGLNSLMAMSIRREAEQLVGMELSATMLWNHPTVSALAAFLADKIAPQLAPTAVSTDPLTAADSGIGVLDDLFDSVEAGGQSWGDGL